jgi:hypothetical protein
LEWLATISPEHESKLRSLLRAETESRETHEQLEWLATISTVHEAQWDAAQHPRGGYPQNRGWFSPTGGSGGGQPPLGAAAPIRTASYRPDRATARIITVSDTASSARPVFGPTSSSLPKIGSGAGAGAGAAAGVFAGGLLGGLRNATMGAYWGRIPGAQAMPSIWVYQLERRVRAGKLAHADAVGIFNTALLGAEAQGFKPTGGTMSAVHKSAVDFLGKAESVYWARKKVPVEGDADFVGPPRPGAKSASAGPPEATPSTNPSQFQPVRGTDAKVHVKTGEIWRKDRFHKNHYEVYKNTKLFENGQRDRSVWEDGRPKEHM